MSNFQILNLNLYFPPRPISAHKLIGSFLQNRSDRVLTPESFPVTRNYKRVLFIRYSAQPLIGTFNPVTVNPSMFKPFVFNMEFPGEERWPLENIGYQEKIIK